MYWPHLSLTAYLIIGGYLLGLALTLVQRPISKRKSAIARKNLAITQLVKWFVWALASALSVGTVLLWSGVPTSVIAVLGGGLATGFAFALRDPLSDFLAAISLLLDKVVNIGDEVTINGEYSGAVVSFGLRGITLETWRGDYLYTSASHISTLKNTSRGDSTAVVDIDVPPTIPTKRAGAVLLAACKQYPELFNSTPEIIGVTAQHLDRYVLRLVCKVPPAEHRLVEYRLKAAAVDAVIELQKISEHANSDTTTAELVTIVEANV